MSIQEQLLRHSPYEPVDHTVAMPGWNFISAGGYGVYEYTNWRDETNSWKKTAYLHTGLNPTDTVIYRGPDVIRFLSKVCVTNFNYFPVGMVKHGLMCNDDGIIIQDGVLIRTGEEEVWSYWMAPMLNFTLESEKYGKFDVTDEYVTDKVFLFQIGGPKSFEILEGVCRDSIRELKHLRVMNTEIAGKKVRIARLGMAGTLSYEVHGNLTDAIDVYNSIWSFGKEKGMRRLGSHSYPMNHAENGLPQVGVHFFCPRTEDVLEYVRQSSNMPFQKVATTGTGNRRPLNGSAGDDVRNYYRNPYELGWGKMIKFDHDFVGREALEKIAEADKRHIVTLEWNADDVADVFASQFRDGEPYKYIDHPNDHKIYNMNNDKVVNEKGETVGISFGRQNSAFFQRMISICCLDKEYAELGNELYLLWGDIGKKQKKIRVRVTRYPFNNVMRNESVDVTRLK